ncbi:hypothetical protein KBY28_07795 [Ruegeria pomeroyi]|uniref:Pam3-gp28 family putative phage holin n=1 Tax=Ruegeria pomeroyi TaxID=89184 RepID=UPI001F254D65|nr:hypothetical protein [Ruegeria pomeroyi]MCE8508352.1 hypothetical protein [Ruegeria pomeroyi]
MMKGFITQKLVGSLIRHTMTVAGGALIAGGYVDESTWQTVTGGAVALGGVALSVAEKKFSFRF